jgi:hypothetical protein
MTSASGRQGKSGIGKYCADGHVYLSKISVGELAKFSLQTQLEHNLFFPPLFFDQSDFTLIYKHIPA